MDKALTAYCGVDCSACRDFQINVCKGCRKTNDDDPCMPVACCREKGVSLCGECKDFPCGDMKEFYRESESHEQAFVLMQKIHNEIMTTPKRGGLNRGITPCYRPAPK